MSECTIFSENAVSIKFPVLAHLCLVLGSESINVLWQLFLVLKGFTWLLDGIWFQIVILWIIWYWCAISRTFWIRVFHRISRVVHRIIVKMRNFSIFLLKGSILGSIFGERWFLMIVRGFGIFIKECKLILILNSVLSIVTMTLVDLLTALILFWEVRVWRNFWIENEFLVLTYFHPWSSKLKIAWKGTMGLLRMYIVELMVNYVVLLVHVLLLLKLVHLLLGTRGEHLLQCLHQDFIGRVECRLGWSCHLVQEGFYDLRHMVLIII